MEQGRTSLGELARLGNGVRSRRQSSFDRTGGNADYTGKHSQYRFHVEDPIYFERSLLFSIELGHANNKQGDWTSTAYWYQTGRAEPPPEVLPFVERVPYGFGGLESWQGQDRRGLPR